MSCPAAVATGERRVTWFVRGRGGEFLALERDGSGWSQPRWLGVPLVSAAGSPTMPVDWPIAACATGRAEIHLLARGPEGELLHGTLRGGEWGGFDCIGSPAIWVGATAVPMGLAGAPAACSCAPGWMDVFAVGAAGALLHSTWHENEFTEFVSLRGVAREGRADEPLARPLSATRCGPPSIPVPAPG